MSKTKREIVADFLNGMNEEELDRAMAVMKSHHNLQARMVIDQFLRMWEIDCPIDAMITTSVANLINLLKAALTTFFEENTDGGIHPTHLAAIVMGCMKHAHDSIQGQVNALYGTGNDSKEVH